MKKLIALALLSFTAACAQPAPQGKMEGCACCEKMMQQGEVKECCCKGKMQGAKLLPGEEHKMCEHMMQSQMSEAKKPGLAPASGDHSQHH